MVIKGGFFKNKKTGRGRETTLQRWVSMAAAAAALASLTQLSRQPTHFYRSPRVIWIRAMQDRMAGVPSTTSPENTNRPSAHPTAAP